MMDKAEFDRLMQMLRDGQTRDDGLAKLIETYRPAVRAAISGVLGRDTRRREGVTDVEELVWIVFLNKASDGTLNADSADLLLAWLRTTARLVAKDRVKYNRAARRDVRREEPSSPDLSDDLLALLPATRPEGDGRRRPYSTNVADGVSKSLAESAAEPASVGTSENLAWTLAAGAPELMAQMRDLLDSFEAREREFIKLKFKGLTHEQISDRLDCSQKTVDRVGEAVRAKLETMTRVTVHSSPASLHVVCIHGGTTAGDVVQLLGFPKQTLRNRHTGKLFGQNDLLFSGDTHSIDDEFDLEPNESE